MSRKKRESHDTNPRTTIPRRRYPPPSRNQVLHPAQPGKQRLCQPLRESVQGRKTRRRLLPPTHHRANPRATGNTAFRSAGVLGEGGRYRRRCSMFPAMAWYNDPGGTCGVLGAATGVPASGLLVCAGCALPCRCTDRSIAKIISPPRRKVRGVFNLKIKKRWQTH